MFSLPEGFYTKKVSPDAAEFMAQYWSPATMEYSMENKVRYLRDTTAAFEMVGVYEEGNDRHPVSWSGVKAGQLKHFINDFGAIGTYQFHYRSCGTLAIIEQSCICILPTYCINQLSSITFYKLA